MKYLQNILTVFSILLSTVICVGQDMTYNVSTVWLETGSDSVGVNVRQSDDKAIATMGDSERIIQVSNPGAGIKSASIDKRMGMLLDAIGSMSPYQPGDVIDLGFGKQGVIRVFEYSLEKGNEKQTIEGYKATQHILSVKLEWSQTSESGNETIGVSSGKSSLWTTNKLPFSWLPYTLAEHNNQKAAVPLSFLHPEIAGFLLQNFEADLKKLGFLLKAKAESEQKYTASNYESANQYVKEVIVSDLQKTSAGPIEIPDLPQISLDTYTELMGWFFITNEYCSKKAGTITKNEEAGGVSKIEGSAEFREIDEKTGITWISMGEVQMRTPEVDNGCLVVGLQPSGTEPGTYPIYNQAAFGERDKAEPAVIACYLALKGGIPQITLFNGGNLEIDSNQNTKITTSGTRVIMEENKSTLIKDAQAEFAFEIVR